MTALLIVNLACDGFRRLGLSDRIDCHCSTDRVQIRVLIPGEHYDHDGHDGDHDHDNVENADLNNGNLPQHCVVG